MPTKTKAKTGGGLATLILAGVVVALASQALPAPGGKGGSGGGYPYTNRRLADDPCPEDAHPDTVIGTWSRALPLKTEKGGRTTNKTTRHREYDLLCSEWRRMVDDLTFDLDRADWPTARDVLECIGNTIDRGEVLTQTGLAGGTNFTLTFVARQRGPFSTYASVRADEDGLVTHAHLAGDVSWAECAAGIAA